MQNEHKPTAPTLQERREFERKLIADARGQMQVMIMADGASPTAGLLSLLCRALVAAHDREDAVLAIPEDAPEIENLVLCDEQTGWAIAVRAVRTALGAEVSQ